MSAESPRECMSTTGRPEAATARSSAGSSPARTSLMMSAPAARTAAATSPFDVSMEIGSRKPRERSRSTTGTTRRGSSSTGTMGAPGRVDSPPRSTRCAPSSAIRSAAATASARARKRPPSEKEPGVAFTIPMTKGPGPSRSRAPSRSFIAIPASSPGSVGLARRPRRRPGARRRRPGGHALGLPGAVDDGRRHRLRRRRARDRAAVHEDVDVGRVERLVLEQRGRDPLERLLALHEDLLRALVLLRDDPVDLRVDVARRLLGVGLRDRHLAAEEDLPLLLAEGERTHLLAHAPLADHPARHLGRALDVVAGTRGLVPEGDLLGDPAAHEDRDLVEGELLVDVEPVLFGELLRHAERAPA